MAVVLRFYNKETKKAYYLNFPVLSKTVFGAFKDYVEAETNRYIVSFSKEN
jgi:hypothetical protein